MKPYLRPTVAPWTALGEHLATVDSTSRRLHERIQTGARAGEVLPEGSNTRADFQTEGRGRLGRSWEGDPAQNLAVSYALSGAGLSAGRLFTLSQNTALVVRELVATLLPLADCRVKWPNDIYVGTDKIAGLLVEASLMRDEPLYVVVGIGLNVNQTSFAYAPAATSLRAAGGRSFDVDAVWVELTRKLQAAHARLGDAVATGDTYGVSRAYHEHLLGLNAWGRYRRTDDGSAFAARLHGVDACGRLMLDYDGEERRFTLDEIKYEGPLQEV